MANESGEQVDGQQWHGGNAPGLAGVYGRLRIAVAGKPVATLVVEGTYVALIPDTTGPADATVMCADEDVMRKLLAGRAEPVHRVDAAAWPASRAIAASGRAWCSACRSDRRSRPARTKGDMT